MSDPTIRPVSCPDKESLSSWFDGEGADTVGDHVEVCGSCKRVVHVYRRVGEALAAEFTPPAGLEDRIWGACQVASETPSSAMRFPFWAHVVRVAAGIVIVAALSSLYWMGNPADEYPVRLAGETGPTTGSGNPFALVQLPAGSVVGPIIPSADSGNLVRTGTSPGSIDLMNRRFLNPTPEIALLPMVLPDSIKHVWVVDDVETCFTYMKEALPSGARVVCAARQDGAVCFQLAMTDVQLQAFVNGLERNGWALVTPDLPQPGEMDKMLLTGKEVLYIVDLVAR